MPFFHRTSTALLCALSGLATLFAMGARPGTGDLPLFLVAGSGAFVGGFVFAGLFGHPGRIGGAMAASAAVLATLTGAALAGGAYGLLVGPTLAGFVVGPAAVGHDILSRPVVLLAWVGTMTLTHLVQAGLSKNAFLAS
jgi:hypothetical protein